MLFTLLAAILGIAALVCYIIVVIDAFKNAIWKGIVSLLCGLYWLYYAIAEFQHPKKWTIVLLAIFGSGLAQVCLMMAPKS